MSVLTISITAFKNFIATGHSRSINAKKNIIFAFLIRGSSFAINLLLLPLTIHYVNPTRYGIWLTLSAIIGWFSFFDVGFGNGLRNKFTEAVTNGKHELARIYVSTTYAILAIIICAALAFFFCINPFLNWPNILNTPPSMLVELKFLVLIVFVFFCLQFILQLLTTVLVANQQPAKASLLNLLISVLSLLMVFVLTKTSQGSLIYLGAALSFSPVIVLVICSIWFYSGEYRRYVPSLKFVRFKFATNLMTLGGKFFIIQIGALVLLETDNIVIIHLFGSKEVTTYNVAYKLFSIVIIAFGIIMAPLWSAFTDAYTKQDIKWIRHLFNKMHKIWLLFILVSFVLLLLSPFLFKLWIGDNVQVPLNVSISMALFAIANAWLLIPCFLLNGIGKIKLQLYLYIVCIFVNIPISIFLGKIYNLPGIAISNILILAFICIILTIQCNKILNGTAKGIWAE